VASAYLADLKTVAAGFRDLATAAAEQALKMAAAQARGQTPAVTSKPTTPQEPVLPPSVSRSRFRGR
jgi:hypothetical protein